MIVTESNAWERAAVRAAARGIEATLVKIAGQGMVSDEYWVTNSTSNPGSRRHVRLRFDENGVSAACDCEAGQRDVPCVHVSAALHESQAMIDNAWIQLQPADEPVTVAVSEVTVASDYRIPERLQSTAFGRYSLAILNGDHEAAEREKALLAAD